MVNSLYCAVKATGRKVEPHGKVTEPKQTHKELKAQKKKGTSSGTQG